MHILCIYVGVQRHMFKSQKCPKSHFTDPGGCCHSCPSCPRSCIDCRPPSVANKLGFEPSKIWLRSPKPSIPCETVYAHKLTDRIVV